MSKTLTIRLPADVETWLADRARTSGRTLGSLVKESLERTRRIEGRPYMALAGSVEGKRDFSRRKGFSAR
jgi:predicted DNA-binding protein